MTEDRPLSRSVKFGAALSTLGFAGLPASGAIVSLNFTTASVAFGSNATIGLTDAGGTVFSIRVLNGFSGPQFQAQGGGVFLGSPFLGSGASITSGLASRLIQSFSSSYGTLTFGFRTASNELGWVRIDVAAFGPPVVLLAGAYNNIPGQGIINGQNVAITPVPETSTTIALAGLATLAAGVGIQRARRKRQATR
ncbi:MAG: hypothetical protein AAFX93_12330 [Verrucomicrobiota bacterium]